MRPLRSGRRVASYAAPTAVADKVLVSCVDQYADAACKLIWEHLLEMMHPITSKLKAERHGSIAVGPAALLVHPEDLLDVVASEERPHVGEVVAQRRHRTFHTHIVRVHAAQLIGHQQAGIAEVSREKAGRLIALACLDGSDACRCGGLH